MNKLAALKNLEAKERQTQSLQNLKLSTML